MLDDEVVKAWRHMATDSFAAAIVLCEKRHWRSALSRAYYAAYSRVVAELVDSGLTMPVAGGPSHVSLPARIQGHMSSMSPFARAAVSGWISKLYGLRIVADYKPMADVGEGDARLAANLMMRVFRSLKQA